MGLQPKPRPSTATAALGRHDMCLCVVAVVLDYCAEEERRERKSKEKGVNKNHGETPHTCEALCNEKLPEVDNRYNGEKGEILSIRVQVDGQYLSLFRRKDKWHRARRLGGKLSMLHFFQFEEQSSLSFIAPLFSRGKIVLLKSIDRSEAVDTNGDSLIRQKTNLSYLSTTRRSSSSFSLFTWNLTTFSPNVHTITGWRGRI